MNTPKDELAQAERMLASFVDKKQALALELREQDIWLSQKNALGANGLRMSVVEHEVERLKRVREKFNTEKEVVGLKKHITFWSNKIVCLRKEIKEAAQQETGYTLQERLNLAQATIEDLKIKLRDWESKYRTLDRNFDTVVRELNALKGERVTLCP